MAGPGKYTGDNKKERSTKFPEASFVEAGRRTPGILLAAPASGSGKTAAACALMAAFQGKGMNVRACKCGPDYIDPMFHREVLGVDSKNLDLFFSDKEELIRGYQRHTEGADIAVVEGVMGYYDGMALDTEKASSYDVARTLGLPVLLVLPARGAALSLAAVVKGVTALDTLEDGDAILISEGCTHHRQCDDIGTVKLPRWIREYTGKEIRIETTSGTEFPDDLTKYKMIIHCGGCMLNEREMKYRLSCAQDQNVPMTNYGILIAYVKGILKRSVEVFPEIAELLDRSGDE